MFFWFWLCGYLLRCYVLYSIFSSECQTENSIDQAHSVFLTYGPQAAIPDSATGKP